MTVQNFSFGVVYDINARDPCQQWLELFPPSSIHVYLIIWTMCYNALIEGTGYVLGGVATEDSITLNVIKVKKFTLL